MNESEKKAPAYVGEAVKIYLRRKEGTLKQAAERMGLVPQTLSAQLTGKSYVSKKVAKALSDTYGISLQFLLSGNGSILGGEENESVIPYPVSITFEDIEGAREFRAPAKSAKTNAAIYTAFCSTRKEINETLQHYKKLSETLEELAPLIDPASEEYADVQHTLEAIRDVTIPRL